MVKSLLIAAALLGAGPGSGVATAKVSLKRLEIRAKGEHKNVLVVFHASWCGWCHKLEGLMESPKFKGLFADNYEILTVDVDENGAKKTLETPGGADLQTQLGAANEGLPFFAACDSSGKVLMDSKNPSNIGYPSKPDEVAYFIKFLKTTAPRVTPDQLTSIQSYLSAHSTE
jgi:thiol-disulfide isomerase/thioredoxin